MKPEALWSLGLEEYAALVEVFERPIKRWGIERADFANAHFRGPGEPAFTVDDVFGLVDRKQRIREARREKLQAERLDRQLKLMKPGQPEPDYLPEWAKRGWSVYDTSPDMVRAIGG